MHRRDVVARWSAPVHFFVVVRLTVGAGKHVVFGNVTKGMDVVKAIEKVGSSSGATSKKVVIADCGQLS